MTDIREDDEDPATIRAAFDRGPHGVTASGGARIVCGSGFANGGFVESHKDCRAALDAAQDEIEKRIEASERDRDQRDRLLALIESQTHLHLDEDGWYSCSQAVDLDALTSEDYMACLDDTRRGKPCDCGRDAMVAKARAIVGGAS